MKLIRDLAYSEPDGDFSGEVVVNSSICYDFVVSLRALFNPRTFTRTRRWSASQLPRLPESLLPKAKFFFQGFDTSLGYGAARIIDRMDASGTPDALIDAVAKVPPAELAMFMLDTGETTPDRLNSFRQVLAGESSLLAAAVNGLPSGWATRCRQLLRDPTGAQADLIDVFDAYLARIYSHHQDAVSESIAKSVPLAAKMLEVLPAAASIERLTGGYTLGADLSLRKVTLAPSVFIHPFMSARVDEQSGEALIIYGIPSDIFDSYDPVPVRRDLIAALKALSDPNRLTLLEILRSQPAYATELITKLGLSQPTVHHHLAQLRTAGLIRQEHDRHGMKYSIRTDSAAEVLRSLTELLGTPPAD